ncbi:MAG: anti-sigma factor family protein [Solirubrobacteraceae bacterium]
MRLRQLRPSFMRDHMWTRRHVHEYLDGELDAHARERVEHHTHLCPKCRLMVAALRRTLEGLRGLRQQPPPSPAVRISDSVIARLRQET